MTVAELIEKLKEMPQDSTVYVCADGRYASVGVEVFVDESDNSVVVGERD